MNEVVIYHFASGQRPNLKAVYVTQYHHTDTELNLVRNLSLTKSCRGWFSTQFVCHAMAVSLLENCWNQSLFFNKR